MGPDEVHPRILREAPFVLADDYTELFQGCLDWGVFSAPWERVVINPIFKKEDLHQPGSFRPISLPIILSKDFEWILKCIVLPHLRDNNFISTIQHGFLPGIKNICVMDILTQKYDGGLISHAIFLDFEKAFGRVPHILLPQSESCGMWSDACTSRFPHGWTLTIRAGPRLSKPSVLTEVLSQTVLSLVYISSLHGNILVNMAVYAADVTSWITGNKIAICGGPRQALAYWFELVHKWREMRKHVIRKCSGSFV